MVIHPANHRGCLIPMSSQSGLKEGNLITIIQFLSHQKKTEKNDKREAFIYFCGSSLAESPQAGLYTLSEGDNSCQAALFIQFCFLVQVNAHFLK